MSVVFLAGGIASGKSTVAAELEELGATRIDLDRVSRDVLAPGTATTAAVAAAFGDDLIAPETGELNRSLLAARAFATPEDAARLEAIELPAIREHLITMLAKAGAFPSHAHQPIEGMAQPQSPVSAAPSDESAMRISDSSVDMCRSQNAAFPDHEMPSCTVVEVPLLDKLGSLRQLADEIVVVCAPADVRLARAVARGMNADDALRRMNKQTSDEWLRSHADYVIENDGSPDELLQKVHAWWNARQREHWLVRGKVSHYGT